MEGLIDRFGEKSLTMATGGLVGVIFRIAAYHSLFCLHAATAWVAIFFIWASAMLTQWALDARAQTAAVAPRPSSS